MVTKRVLFDNDEYFDCFKYEINGIKTENQIICIADLGLWNGRRQGYKLLNNNLSSVLDVINSDHCGVVYWVDGYGNLRARLGHYDSTDYVLFRELRKPVDSCAIRNFLSKIYNS